MAIRRRLKGSEVTTLGWLPRQASFASPAAMGQARLWPATDNRVMDESLDPPRAAAPNAEPGARELRLAYALNQVLEARKLSQADAAKVLGVTQPKVSGLRHYKLAGFSVERLMNLLTALDQDVEIVIRQKPRSRKTGRISVVAA